ncbi:MAG TPA: Xaa-Pro peptidase family protein [Thermoanaerobaculia bacterium]|nr:Xaa-Pro peptidase family protein [Thermoanaerobaculia bacterium]
MNRKTTALPASLALLGGLALAVPVAAQRIEYPPEEFAERRRALCEVIEEDALVLLFSKTEPARGVRFRQDHDFYYLTGNENLNSALALDATSCEARLFLVTQTEREASRDGWNWLHQEGAAARRGFAELRPLHALEEFLSRRRISGTQVVYVRLSERDEIDQSRGDTAIFQARRMVNPWGGQPSEDAWRVRMFRERYPHYELRDVSPRIDRLRMIKRPREIEALRRAGQVSAAAIRRSIESTAPGRFEYELEAEATHEMIKSGAEHAAYAAIVGSGPNVNVWHHNRNDRLLEEGDLVVMDYGASFGYQTMDITRTWPVSGRFDELQERAYRATLEAQKAVIAAMRPGVTREQTQEICRQVFEKWGFGDQSPSGAGHFVGMAVHDVGFFDEPLQAGMVIAVEPIIEISDEQLHVRIEDTVLITEDGAEVLSGGVPKELDEVLALVGRGVRSSPGRPETARRR